jgi:hypothetical protein
MNKKHQCSAQKGDFVIDMHCQEVRGVKITIKGLNNSDGQLTGYNICSSHVQLLDIGTVLTND